MLTCTRAARSARVPAWTAIAHARVERYTPILRVRVLRSSGAPAGACVLKGGAAMIRRRSVDDDRGRGAYPRAPRRPCVLQHGSCSATHATSLRAPTAPNSIKLRIAPLEASPDARRPRCWLYAGRRTPRQRCEQDGAGVDGGDACGRRRYGTHTGQRTGRQGAGHHGLREDSSSHDEYVSGDRLVHGGIWMDDRSGCSRRA